MIRYLSRRSFMAAAGGSALGLMLSGCFNRQVNRIRRQPNVIVILTDDQGYADIGCFGARDIPTPNIDSIACNGVRFTNGYVTAPLCSPSRAGLISGRYPTRFGYEFNRTTDPACGLPPGVLTIADQLKTAGYTTGIVGKWDMGMGMQHHPCRRGFDEFYGFIDGANNYMDRNSENFQSLLKKASPVDPESYILAHYCDAWHTADGFFIEFDRSFENYNNTIMRNFEVTKENEYLTDAFSREAVEFIGRHKAEPFFLYLAYNAPHTPLQAPRKYLDRFKDADILKLNCGPRHIYPLEKRRTYAAMVSAIDDGVGAILATLRSHNLQGDTIVFFLSDNGGWLFQSSNNTPLQSGKSSILEGGIRVPFIAQMPGVIPAGVVCDEPVISLDIGATALSLTGTTPPTNNYDGVNLIPYLTGHRAQLRSKSLFWRVGNHQWAIRNGRWKLLQQFEGSPCQLFDLNNDPGEKTDIASGHPELVKQLKAEFDAWSTTLIQPLWPDPWSKKQPRIVEMGASGFQTVLK